MDDFVEIGAYKI